jgi:uncharacterized protein VirK/YbjX
VTRIFENDVVTAGDRDNSPSLIEANDLPFPHLREAPDPNPELANVFRTSVWRLARQQYYWSSSRFFRLARTLLKHIPTQIEVLRVLSRPEYLRLIAINPRFPWKWLGVDYLARGLTVAEQSECFMHHYRRLPDLIPEHILVQILLADLLLDEFRKGDDRFAIRMAFSRPWDYEGELSLNFEVDNKLVFVLSFTIIPGWVVKSEATEVVLISRIQGVKGCYDEIQLATKAMSDVAPPAILVAALCGFAEAFGIDVMAGINATMKPEWHLCEGEAQHIEQAYDEFFVELGATKGPANFYISQLPPLEKPLTLIKRGHKTRTRTKRALKREIAQRICKLLRDSCARS